MPLTNSRLILNQLRLTRTRIELVQSTSKRSLPTTAATTTLSVESMPRNWCQVAGCSGGLITNSTPYFHFGSGNKPTNGGGSRPLLLTIGRHLGTQVPRPYIDPKLSYVFGKSNEHLVYSTVARELDKRISEKPDELAFVSHAENKRVTFRELDQQVNKVAKAMVKSFNVKRGDYVGVFAYNCLNWILIQLACSRIGAILTPINPSYKSSELEHILKKGKVKCLFMPGPKSPHRELNNHLDVLQSKQILELARMGKLELQHVVLIDGENTYTILQDSFEKLAGEGNAASESNSIVFKLANCQLHNWSSTDNDGQVFKSAHAAEAAGLSEQEACIIDPELVSPDDCFAVYYTSGTTGVPKGACVSQFTVVNNVRLCQIRIRHGRPQGWRTRAATVLPMFHIFAGVLNTLSPLLNSATIIYASYKYDIKTFVEAIYEHQANIVTLTPTILIDMLAHIEANKLTNVPLKIIQSGGAALSPEVVTRTFKTLPDLEELRTGYGSTENGAVASFQTIHEPTETRSITVGPPIDFCEIRIVKPGTDHVVPHGERGEVQTRGFNTMTSYLDEPQKTAEAITANGWYRTGDLGLLHPHGSLQICGRIKQMIIKGGENIYPEEVEQLIHKLEYVEDAHVVGVPDDRFGEQVCAWIKLKPGYRGAMEVVGLKESPTPEQEAVKLIQKEDVIKFCKTNITYFKVPKYLLFVDEFPMTPTKKVQNHIMTKMSCEILGLKMDKT